MKATSKQHEKLAQACLKASRDKKVPANKRMEFRTKGAKRHRLLAKLAAKEEAKSQKSRQKPLRPANDP
jgi:hypothetical protein